MRKINYFVYIVVIFSISSCGVLFDDPIVKFWNDGIRPSKNEMNSYSQCMDESEAKYPKSIDPDGSQRVLYTRDCMKQKGYW